MITRCLKYGHEHQKYLASTRIILKWITLNGRIYTLYHWYFNLLNYDRENFSCSLRENITRSNMTSNQLKIRSLYYFTHLVSYDVTTHNTGLNNVITYEYLWSRSQLTLHWSSYNFGYTQICICTFSQSHFVPILSWARSGKSLCNERDLVYNILNSFIFLKIHLSF